MKNKFQLMFGFVLIAFIAINTAFAQKTYNYQSVPNDPLKARIYTLDNGLKVYMTVYKDAPRIQTYIAVRAGSKNDPHETTGLAHYFEHMMFKGSNHFGTTDYAKEAPLIQQIENLFEIYRVTKDSATRANLYHQIDSISYIASTIAIPNEYDKLMSAIGADGTNAYTSLEQTVYVEEIPSNQLENWVKIEADRFTTPVLRLFHTELETIYEEKNMTLTSDSRKVYTALLSGLFSKHPYGTQTTIGEAEHIKNPSMKNIRTYFSQYYVPNNMAVCISGDFDPDNAIKLIDKYFGGLKSSNVPAFTFAKETPIQEPIVKEVVGPDAENITLAYRFDGVNSKDADMITILDMVLTNGTAGLIDINLNKKQKVLSSGSGPEVMKDYSYLSLNGKPKTGQTLDEVKDLLLSQIELLKKGEFADWMLPAIINDLKLRTIKDFESNRGRANSFVEAFVLGEDWKDFIETTERLSKITKQDIVNFAKQNLNNNYVIVYKRTGKDKDVVKVKKPKITPIKINRDLESDFVKNINESKVPAIEPVFVDYNKDIQKLSLKNNIQLNYKENTENKTFELSYVFNMGSNNDKKLGVAIQYLKYLGTSKFSPEQTSEEFYKVGCSFNVSNSSDQVYVSLSGLSENFEKGLMLFENLLSDPQANKDAFDNLINDILKKRKDAKLNVQNIFRTLVTYGYYGPKSPTTNILSETELKALTPAELIQKIKELCSFEHHILFYGDIPTTSVVKTLNAFHKTPDKLKSPLPETKFVELPTTENKVFHADFTMKQIQLMMLQKSDGAYDKTKEPIVTLFNEYFGGSMNSIVFQELREARALAYSAMSTYRIPSKIDRSYYGISYIATQTDKMGDALKGLNDLLNNMPESEKAFKLAKESIIQKLRTDRITKSGVLWSYENAKKLGLDYDLRKDVFLKVPTLTFSDVKAFEEKTLKNQAHSFMVLGDKKDIDFDLLSKYGKVTHLTLEEIFGY